MNFRGLSAAAVVALAAVGGVANAQFKPSKNQQIEIGQNAAIQVREQANVLPDSDPRVKELRRLGRRLVSLISEKERKEKPFQYTFDIIESDEINAFALPGGPIFLYTGLLDKLETEDQVAGILAHELTHIRNEHWASAYNDNQKRQLGLLALLLILDANKDIFDIASISDTLLFTLPYSRRNESDSDKVGYALMLEADLNPQGMVDVFNILKEEGASSQGMEWLSTHPDADRRVKNIEKRISDSNESIPPQTPRSKFVIWRSYVSGKRTLPGIR